MIAAKHTDFKNLNKNRKENIKKLISFFNNLNFILDIDSGEDTDTPKNYLKDILVKFLTISGKSLERIRFNFSSGNTELVFLQLPDGIQQIDGSFCQGTTNLQKFKFPSDLQVLGRNAFHSSGITELVLHDKVSTCYFGENFAQGANLFIDKNAEAVKSIALRNCRPRLKTNAEIYKKNRQTFVDTSKHHGQKEAEYLRQKEELDLIWRNDQEKRAAQFVKRFQDMHPNWLTQERQAVIAQWTASLSNAKLGHSFIYYRHENENQRSDREEIHKEERKKLEKREGDKFQSELVSNLLLNCMRQPEWPPNSPPLSASSSATAAAPSSIRVRPQHSQPQQPNFPPLSASSSAAAAAPSR